jgi:Zn-dependent peptidase ImmA (M78 family)
LAPGLEPPVPLEAVWALAETHRLNCAWTALARDAGILAVYTWDPVLQAGIVVLDDQLPQRPRLLKSVLAEEIGHHVRLGDPGRAQVHTNYSLRVGMGRAETRALRWAVDLLLPRDAFLAAVVEEGAQVAAVAERFDVTEWLVRRAVDFRQEELRAIWRLAGEL